MDRSLTTSSSSSAVLVLDASLPPLQPKTPRHPVPVATRRVVQCRSNRDWRRKVEGAKGASYEVRWEYLVFNRHQYGWTCTCPAFRRNEKICEHINKVKDEPCWWGALLDHEDTDGQTNDEGAPCCPDCRGPVVFLPGRMGWTTQK